jgi:hypothetical protein
MTKMAETELVATDNSPRFGIKRTLAAILDALRDTREQQAQRFLTGYHHLNASSERCATPLPISATKSQLKRKLPRLFRQYLTETPLRAGWKVRGEAEQRDRARQPSLMVEHRRRK